MVIIQSGLPKSGNYWLYKILQEVMQSAGIPQRSYVKSQPIYEDAKTWPYFEDQAGIDYLEVDSDGHYFRKGDFRQRIEDIDHYISRCSHVWTHTLWTDESADVFRKFDKIIYIIRDPRDVVISASRYSFTPFVLEQHPHKEPDQNAFVKHRLYELVLSWVQHVGGYLMHKDEYQFHVVCYERLLHSFDEELSHIVEYLGVDLPSSEFDVISDAVDFSTMKKKSPYHVRKGKSGQWVDVLNSAQIIQVNKMAGPLLSLLNYPLEESQVGESLPQLPGELDRCEIKVAMDSSRGDFFDKMKYAYAFLTSRRPLMEKFGKGLGFLFARGKWGIDN